MMAFRSHGSPAAAVSTAANAFGILYAEDFDNPLEHGSDASEEPASTPQAPVITQADVDAACAAAVQSARTDWQLADQQMRLKAIASLGSALAGIRHETEQSAIAIAEGTVTTILSIVTGLLPHFTREHGPAEVRALLGRLLPTIRSQTRITVRVHADMVTAIERDVSELEPDLAAMIDVAAAPLERGDAKVSWENGSMARDSRKIIQAIGDALSELGLQQTIETASKKRMAYAD